MTLLEHIMSSPIDCLTCKHYSGIDPCNMGDIEIDESSPKLLDVFCKNYERKSLSHPPRQSKDIVVARPAMLVSSRN